MSFEVVMLKSAAVMKSRAKRFVLQAQRLATHSYDATRWRFGTIGQVNKVAELLRKRDLYESLFWAVAEALKKLPPAYRTLLIKVYIHDWSLEAVAERYSASVSTVNRRLKNALSRFGKELKASGWTEEWVRDNFRELKWNCHATE